MTISKDGYADAEELQDSMFQKGYLMCRIKNGIDPIPNLLPATDAYRKWMAGWNSGLYELGLLKNHKNSNQGKQS